MGGMPPVGPPRRRSRTAPSQRTRAAEPTRFAAYTVLRAVADGAYANIELPTVLRDRRLDPRDAAFATELTFGTLRWQGLYDAIIAAASGRQVESIDPAVLDCLRLGTHQLLRMRVPAHAAADQSVGLAKVVAGAGAGGFVNAVLRRIGERDLDAWVDAVAPSGSDPAALAARHSHPAWVVAALRAALLGHGAATPESVHDELVALLESDNVPPEVHLVARPGLADVESLLADRGAGEARPSALSRIGVVLGSGDPSRIAAVRDGRAAVQDVGSQLLALALAEAEVRGGGSGVGVETPERWLDLCAGPGGKAGVLAGLAVAAGADLTAVEVSPHRADLVRSSLRAMTEYAADSGRSIEVRTADGREIGEAEPTAYSRVLVDAPCTGLGALRRRPEARWRRTPADLAQLGPLQRALLASALDAVAPGGVVGYATCSPHLAETTFVVGDVLKKRSDVEVLDARPLFRDASGREIEGVGPGPYVQLWPHRHGTDAMFFALLRKRS